MDRYGQTAERYLAEHHVLVYLEDSISQLLEHREENPKVNTHKFLAEYFSSLRDGNHTMFRNFSFIKATPHNRAAFIRLFWNSFKQIGQRGDLLSMKEYHSLTRLLCPDFPLELLQKTARIVLMDDALDCLISFPDFLYAFQVQFYYEEFLEKATELYRSLQQSQKSPREAVVVPSSTDDQPSVCQRAATQRQEAVEGSLLFRHLYQLCDKAEFSVPPNSVLKELLDISQVTYCGFLLFIAKSDTINKTIGQLPPKVELLETISREINVPSLQLAVSNKPAVITSGMDNSAKPSRTSTNTAPKTVRITKQKLKVSGSREIRRKSEKSSSSSSSGHSDGSTTD